MSLENVKILVVDDDEVLRQTLADVLTLDSAIVEQASDGSVAFEMILKNKYNVVISDVRMSICSGIDLLHKLKSHKGRVPEVIMMSAFSDLTTQKAQELGARALFLKPAKIDEIKELIKAIV